MPGHARARLRRLALTAPRDPMCPPSVLGDVLSPCECLSGTVRGRSAPLAVSSRAGHAHRGTRRYPRTRRDSHRHGTTWHSLGRRSLVGGAGALLRRVPALLVPAHRSWRERDTARFTGDFTDSLTNTARYIEIQLLRYTSITVIPVIPVISSEDFNEFIRFTTKHMSSASSPIKSRRYLAAM